MWCVSSSRLPQEGQILTISHRLPGRDHSPECRPIVHIAFFKTLISAPVVPERSQQ